MTSTLCWRLELPPELAEILTAELWAGGCLGIEERPGEGGRLRFEVYFPHPLPAAAAAFDFERWRRRGVELAWSTTVDERDWLADYRRQARPVDVGRRLRVDPGDPGGRDAGTPDAGTPDAGGPQTAPAGRFTLRIPAQSAFGTGSHESTRLALCWLEELDLTGLDVLDVGTGSGILSFAAELFGARRVVAFDRDAQAVAIAGANARANALGPCLYAGRLAALRPAPAFDLALVNILPENVLGELPRLLALLRPGGRIIDSGNLLARREELLERLAAVGLRLVGEKRENEWTAFLLAAGGRR